MKKLTVFIASIIMLFVVGSMAYAGQFGPPEPAAKEGKDSVGIGYFSYSAKWKPNKTEGGWETSKVTQNQAYLQLGYGFVKNWEAYMRVGGADAKLTKIFDTTAGNPNLSGFKSDFKDNYQPFGTIGIKGVFNLSQSFGIGPFFQGSFYFSYKDDTTGTDTGVNATQKAKVKNNSADINLGLGLQGKIGQTIIYGGPVAYWRKAKVYWTETGAGIAGSDAVTFKEKNNIGGFAGIRIPLSKSLNLEIEGQQKSRFSMGGALTYSF